MKYLMDPSPGVNPALMIHCKISHSQTQKQAVENKMGYNKIVLIKVWGFFTMKKSKQGFYT